MDSDDELEALRRQIRDAFARCDFATAERLMVDRTRLAIACGRLRAMRNGFDAAPSCEGSRADGQPCRAKASPGSNPPRCRHHAQEPREGPRCDPTEQRHG